MFETILAVAFHSKVQFTFNMYLNLKYFSKYILKYNTTREKKYNHSIYMIYESMNTVRHVVAGSDHKFTTNVC